MAASRLEPAVCQHGSIQSVCRSIHPSTLCVCVCVSSFTDGVFYSALPLYKSTVALGQSLGVGKNEGFHGAFRMR